MKKFARVLSIVSMVFAALGLLMFAVIIANYRSLIEIFSGLKTSGAFFVLPVGRLIYAVGILICALLMLKSVTSRRIGIEVTSIILLFVVPRVQTIASYMQSMIFANYQGTLYSASLSAMNTICSFAGAFSSIAAFLMLLACGLRIGYKKTR